MSEPTNAGWTRVAAERIQQRFCDGEAPGYEGLMEKEIAAAEAIIAKAYEEREADAKFRKAVTELIRVGQDALAVVHDDLGVGEEGGTNAFNDAVNAWDAAADRVEALMGDSGDDPLA